MGRNIKQRLFEVEENFDQEEGMEPKTTSGLWEASLQQLPSNNEKLELELERVGHLFCNFTVPEKGIGVQARYHIFYGNSPC